MLMKKFATRTAIGLLVLASACGDDSKAPTDEGDSSFPGAGGKLGDGSIPVLRADGGVSIDIDASTATGLDGAVVTTSADGAVRASDGAVVDSATPTDTLDAAQPVVPVVPDASAPVPVPDAAVVDAATSTPADAGACSINDPRFGCGTAISDNWVRFDNGLEVDRVSGNAWTPVRTPLSDTGVGPDTENENYCLSLNFAGLTTWVVPEIDAVRTLAAGCTATAAGGACPVTEMRVSPVTDGSCTCADGTPPPSAAGFCRPELSSCDTLWTRTWCGADGLECGTYQHWFYLSTDGSIVLRPYENIPPNVKGRCVTKLEQPYP
ncbi:MAG: hypothetical protein JWN04_2667 [Myxococcaceae bacterium]|nr:hypothetical protein [Myxococcaceae bacterium]